MKNVTLSAEADLIERARLRAVKERRTLNAAFRDWLRQYAGGWTDSAGYAGLMEKLSHVQTETSFTRAERNRR